ncbi:MAG: MBL fold metallo-hydrolase RNA specificity domain-containing protein [Burkholderiales bacterium]
MKLTFLGAAGEVTGSSYLIEAAGLRLLVDCGMFQGGREADAKNRARFAFDPATLDCVLLTHAHIDHSGLLPRLVAAGFRGPVYATAATCDLLEVMLLDSAHIQEKELEWMKKSKTRGAGKPPLYTVAEATRSLRSLKPVAYGEELRPHEKLRCVFRDAGHIIGSAIIELWIAEGGRTRKIVFSGDIGQPCRPLVRDPAVIAEADVLIVESTYGNRLHRTMDETLAELEHAVTDTLVRKKGKVIIPAFAVGRTQEIVYLLVDLYRQGRLPQMDIYIDSPMATKATEITARHWSLLDKDAAAQLQWLKRHRGQPKIHFVQDVLESTNLQRIKHGAVIISASGMCNAGRIKHHLRHNLGPRDSTLLIVGFQAAGTLGRRIVDGARSVRIFGIPVPVRADVYTINGLSAHADRDALLAWMRNFKKPPARTFIVHGEESVAAVLADAVRARLGWREIDTPALHSSAIL